MRKQNGRTTTAELAVLAGRCGHVSIDDAGKQAFPRLVRQRQQDSPRPGSVSS
jgi:hypothetical protein